MRNILQIAKEDLRKISLNAISLLVVIGLVCIPSVYAWFNIGGSWDPYGSTGDIVIGVVNEDQGYENEYLPITISVGDSVTNMLTKNTTFKWEFYEKDEALEQLKNANLYAAVEIPKDFSENVMSILTDNAKPAELIYYNDEKMNALAPKITGKGATSIQKEVNTVISEQVLNAIFKTAQNLIDVGKSDTVQGLIQKLSTGFGDASLSLQGATLQLASVSDLIDSVQELFNKINSLMPNGQEMTAQQLHETINQIAAHCDEAKSNVDDLIQWLEDMGISQEGLQTLREISSLLEQIKSTILTAHVIGDDVVSNIASLQTTLRTSQDLLDSLQNNIANVMSDFDVISADLLAAKTSLDSLNGNATLDQVQKIIGNNPKSLAHLIAAPVQIERHAIWPIENNGSSMAAFYTALSIWVGCTLLLAIMKVDVSPARIEAMNKRNKRKAKEAGRQYWPVLPRHIYFGRYIIFGLMAVAQATLICLGEIFFLGIQCVHPMLFLMTGWILAILFSFFIYTLTVSFGNIGKAIAVILLVLQIAASGGMFPKEMICWPFNLVYPYLPLTYAIDSFHYCIAGFNDPGLFIAWFWLAINLIVISLLLGLVLRKAIAKGNQWFVAKIHESNLIA